MAQLDYTVPPPPTHRDAARDQFPLQLFHMRTAALVRSVE